MSAYRFQFQFHKGTIRTDEMKEVNDAELNFNSIKVQLEQTPFSDGKA